MPYFTCTNTPCDFTGRLPRRLAARGCLACQGDLREIKRVPVQRLMPRGVDHSPARPAGNGLSGVKVLSPKPGALVIHLDVDTLLPAPASPRKRRACRLRLKLLRSIYEHGGRVREALKAVPMSPSRAYQIRRSRPVFAAIWDRVRDYAKKHDERPPWGEFFEKELRMDGEVA